MKIERIYATGEKPTMHYSTTGGFVIYFTTIGGIFNVGVGSEAMAYVIFASVLIVNGTNSLCGERVCAGIEIRATIF